MITIIDYNSGNIGSVCNALDRLKMSYEVTSDREKIMKAEKVIFPGVGRAGQAMQELRKRDLIEVVKNIKVPFLGICLGMQLLFEYSEEDETECLGRIPGKVMKFKIPPNPPLSRGELSIPQIGWNKVYQAKKDPVFNNIQDSGYFYFVNSYYVDCEDEFVLGKSFYGNEFASIVKKDNFYGMQFHPEKSGDLGERLLGNFCSGSLPDKSGLGSFSIVRDKTLRALLDRGGCSSRLISCMDVNDGKVVKGVNYKNWVNLGDPVELGKHYSQEGIDELMFLDVRKDDEEKESVLELIRMIAETINIPFSVGGGIKDIPYVRKLLNAGADKVCIGGTSAVYNQNLVQDASNKFGAQCIAISLDVKKIGKKWNLFVKTGTENTGIDALDFAPKIEEAGAGELLVNSIDRDGTKDGYDIELLEKIKNTVSIPVIASSGAGKKRDFVDAFNKAKIDACLAASIFHTKAIEIDELKRYLQANNIKVRL